MEGLLLKLSHLDSDAEAAVRVIAYFDALIARNASLPALVRATATLAECPAALRQPDGRVLRGTPGGPAAGPGASASPDPTAAPAPSASACAAGFRAWLERPPGDTGRWDELVVERMALAASILHNARPRAEQDPAPVERVLSARQSAEDRARALRQVGLAPDRPLRVAAVLGATGSPAPSTVLDGVTAVLVQPAGDDAWGDHARGGRACGGEARRGKAAGDAPTEEADLGLGDGAYAGLGSAVDAAHAYRSWREARVALRFARAGEGPVVAYASLGPLALLAAVPAAELRAYPGADAIEAFARTPRGAADLAVVEAFCRTGSLRRAAAALHLHHSSVSTRLERAERALGRRLSEPEDRFRLRLALLALRLAGTGDGPDAPR